MGGTRAHPTQAGGFDRSRRALVVAGILAGLSTFRASAQQVEMSLERYEAMRDAATVVENQAPPPAAAIAFERAALDIDVHPDRADVEQTLEVAVYSEGPQTLPLATIGSLTAADLGGLEGRLDASGGTAGDGWVLHLEGRGRHTVRLTSALPVTADPRTTYRSWRLTLPLPAAAMVHGTIRVPSEIDRVESDRVQPAGDVVVERPDAEGRRAFVAAGESILDLVLSGGSAQPNRETLPLRFVARSGVTLIAGRSRRLAHASLVADVRQGQLDELVLPLPAEYEVLGVESDARIGWRLEQESTPGPSLIVTPATPVTDALAVRVRMAAPPGEDFEAPLLAPRGADWIRHAVRAGAGADGILDLAERGDARPPEGSEIATLGSLLDSASGPPWVIPEGGFAPRWTLRWADDTSVLAAQVDRLLVEVLLADDGRAYYRTWVETRNAGATELAIRMPGGARLIDARRDGQPAIPGRRGEELVLPLAAHERPQILQLEAMTSVALPSRGRFDLPIPSLSAPASRVEVRIIAGTHHGLSLSNPKLEDSVSAPSQPITRAISTSLAQQLNAFVDLDSAPAVEGFLVPPLGWTVLEATWNALVSDPGPLALELDRPRELKEWF